MDNQIVNSLIKLAMNERQSKVYLALLENSGSTASELHRLSGVALSKTYETLKFLNGNGYCMKRNIEKNIIYLPVDPKISFEKVIDEKREELKSTEELVVELEKIFNAKPKEGELLNYIEVVYGNSNIHKKFLELYDSSSRSILGIGTSPYSENTLKQNMESKEAYDSFIARGGSDRTITELNDETPPFVFHFVKSMVESGELENNRVMDSCPMKLVIFDDETLLTMDKSSDQVEDQLCCSIIKQSAAVKTYLNMFNYLFNDAENIEDWIESNRELYQSKLDQFDNQK